MTATESQKLVRLEECIPETNLVAIIRPEPNEIKGLEGLEFRDSFDDLDYLIFATLPLPSGDRVALVRHQNSPTPGTEICVRHDPSNIKATIQEALTEMNLTAEDLTWIHPELETADRE